MQVLVKENAQFKKGVISTLAGIFKHGQREHMIEHAQNVLSNILTFKFSPSELLVVRKPLVKLTQRLGNALHLFKFSNDLSLIGSCIAGLVFLKPRVATWRYQRGSRSLKANLLQMKPAEIKMNPTVSHEDEDSDDYDVPEEIENVFDEILQALRDKNREVQ